MRVPKRLPKRLADYVSRMERDGARLIAASMSRARGRAFISLTLTQPHEWISPDLITAEFSLTYDRNEHEFKNRFKEQLSSHRRNFDLFRKAVLAS